MEAEFLFQDYETTEFTEDKLARFQRSALLDREALAETKRIESWKRKREKLKQKKKEKSEESNQASQQLEDSGGTIKEYTQPNKYKWRNMKYEEINFSLPNIVIDLSFTREQPERELRSVSTQMSMSYCSVRKSTRPVYLHICSFEGPITELARRQTGFDTWKVILHEEPFWDTFDTDKVIYMTPDSDYEMEIIEEDKVYIIGGISDNNNSMKNATKELAIRRGIKTAKLPIDKYLDKRHRKDILNVNHVVDILVSVAEDGDWHKAINTFVPQRYQIE